MANKGSFKVGNKPKGHKPKLPREIIVKQKLTKAEFVAKIGKYSSEITFDQLGRIVSKEQRGKENVMDLWIASAIYKGISEGDDAKLTRLMEKVIGKLDPPKEINIHHSGNPRSMWQLSDPQD